MGERVIFHRITVDEVSNVDFAKDIYDKDVLNVTFDEGSITIQFSTDPLNAFKQKIADEYQYLRLPQNIYTKSKQKSLNSDESFLILEDDLIGNVELSREAGTNAPYLLIRTQKIKSYPRILQIYLSDEHIEKLDEISIRDYHFVVSTADIQTVNATSPNILFTYSDGSYMDFEIPAGSITALKSEAANERIHLEDPLTVQTIATLSSQNILNYDVIQDIVTSVSIGHTVNNVSYLQVTTEDPSKLFRGVFTIYMDKSTFLDFETQISGW